MEDAHAAVLDLQAKSTGGSEKPTDPDKRLAFFGVYDGHGGDKVALFAGENVHKIVAKQEAFAKGDIEQALKDGFLATDRAILEGKWTPLWGFWNSEFCSLVIVRLGVLKETDLLDPKYEEEVSGCTAAVSVISKNKIWVVCTFNLYPTAITWRSGERLIGMVGKRGRFTLSIGCKGPRKAAFFRPQATE